MFGRDADLTPLKLLVQSAFSGRVASIGELEDFVATETDYLISHLRRGVLIPLEEEGVIEVTGRKRKGTYPEATIIRFP